MTHYLAQVAVAFVVIVALVLWFLGWEMVSGFFAARVVDGIFATVCAPFRLVRWWNRRHERRELKALAAIQRDAVEQGKRPARH